MDVYLGAYLNKKLQGKKAEEIAEKVGVSPGTLSKYRRNLFPIPQDTVKLFYQVFGDEFIEAYFREVEKVKLRLIREAK